MVGRARCRILPWDASVHVVVLVVAIGGGNGGEVRCQTIPWNDSANVVVVVVATGGGSGGEGKVPDSSLG